VSAATPVGCRHSGLTDPVAFTARSGATGSSWVGGNIGEEPGHPDDVDSGGGGSSSDDEDDGYEDGDVKRWRILYAALDKVRVGRSGRPPDSGTT